MICSRFEESVPVNSDFRVKLTWTDAASVLVTPQSFRLNDDFFSEGKPAVKLLALGDALSVVLSLIVSLTSSVLTDGSGIRGMSQLLIIKDGNWTVESVSAVSQSHATASILLAGLVLAGASGLTSSRAHHS